MAVGLVVGVACWIGWATAHRRLRLADVATALMLLLAPLLCFVVISYSYYGSYIDP